MSQDWKQFCCCSTSRNTSMLAHQTCQSCAAQQPQELGHWFFQPKPWIVFWNSLQVWLPDDRHGLLLELCCLTSELWRIYLLWNCAGDWGEFEFFAGCWRCSLDAEIEAKHSVVCNPHHPGCIDDARHLILIFERLSAPRLSWFCTAK